MKNMQDALYMQDVLYIRACFQLTLRDLLKDKLQSLFFARKIASVDDAYHAYGAWAEAYEEACREMVYGGRFIHYTDEMAEAIKYPECYDSEDDYFRSVINLDIMAMEAGYPYKKR